jgi:hypothetical protein
MAERAPCGRRLGHRCAPITSHGSPGFISFKVAKWVNDRTHGQQFKARSCAHRPTSADGIEKYLSSGTSGQILRADEGYCGAAGSGVCPRRGMDKRL